MPTDPQPHQLTAEECAADAPRAQLNLAKHAAHEAYLAAKRILDHLDETADPAWIDHAKTAMTYAWEVYSALLLETEW